MSIKIQYAPTFVRMYKPLAKALQQEVMEKVEVFKQKKNHQSLKVHKLKGIKNTYSFSVNYKIRIVSEYDNKDTANLLLVGSRDGVY